MKVIEKKLSEIKPYENNPRNNEDAVQYVANSLKKFGWKQPIVIDKDGVIVAGHTRYRAAESLGMKTVPCVIADDLTEEEIRGYRLADNKTAEMAGWNFPLLDLELAEITTFDMADFGFADFNHDDIDDFFENADNVEKEEKLHVITCPHCGERIVLTKDFHIQES
jgi:ParB-like chromosome segregation protein Spo0J